MTNDQIESAATDHASKYPEHLRTDIVLHYGLGIVRGLKEGREELAAKDKEIEELRKSVSLLHQSMVDAEKRGHDKAEEAAKAEIEKLTKIILDFRTSRPS